MLQNPSDGLCKCVSVYWCVLWMCVLYVLCYDEKAYKRECIACKACLFEIIHWERTVALEICIIRASRFGFFTSDGFLPFFSFLLKYTNNKGAISQQKDQSKRTASANIISCSDYLCYFSTSIPFYLDDHFFYFWIISKFHMPIRLGRIFQFRSLPIAIKRQIIHLGPKCV